MTTTARVRGADRGLEVLGADVEVVLAADIAEDRCGAGMHDRVRRRDEVERRHKHLVSGAAAGGEQREVERGRAVRDRQGVTCPGEAARTRARARRPAGPMLHQPERRACTTASSISSSTRTSESGTLQAGSSRGAATDRGVVRRPFSTLRVATAQAPCEAAAATAVAVKHRRRQLDPGRDGLLVVVSPADVEPEPVVPIGADLLSGPQQGLHQIREVEVAAPRDVLQRLRLDGIDAHAHGRGHLRLLVVGRRPDSAGHSRRGEDAVVDLDRAALASRS